MSVLQLYRYIVSNSNKKYSQLMLKKVENENTFTSPKPTLVPLYQIIVYEKETRAKTSSPVPISNSSTETARFDGLRGTEALCKHFARSCRNKYWKDKL